MKKKIILWSVCVILVLGIAGVCWKCASDVDNKSGNDEIQGPSSITQDDETDSHSGEAEDDGKDEDLTEGVPGEEPSAYPDFEVNVEDLLGSDSNDVEEDDTDTTEEPKENPNDEFFPGIY